MSLIDNHGANTRVAVILRKMGKDARERPVPVEVGRVTCFGRLEPSTSQDVERYAGTGTAVAESMRFTTSVFPGDDLSQVVTEDGTVWEVMGEVSRHRASRRTSRDRVMLTATSQVRAL